MPESNPRWMTRTGLVLLLIPLIYNLWYALKVSMLLVVIHDYELRLVLQTVNVLAILLLLPELRSRLAPVACLFLLTLLPICSGSELNPQESMGLAFIILAVGLGFMVYSVGGSAGLYLIIGCLCSWLFTLSVAVPEIQASRKPLETLTEIGIQIGFALSLGFGAMMIQKTVCHWKLWWATTVLSGEEPINGS